MRFSFFLIFTIFFSFNLLAQSLDVQGVYVGEMHRNPVNAQKFIDRVKTGMSNDSGGILSIFSNPKKKTQYFYVTQNQHGVHLVYIDRKILFASMDLNQRGEFSGKFNNHLIEGYFEDNLLWAHVKLHGNENDPHYLVGTLSPRDQDIKKEIGGLKGAKETITNLENEIKILTDKVNERDTKIADLEKAHAIDIEDILEEGMTDTDNIIKKHKKELDDLQAKLNVQPQININNIYVQDSAKKGAILWSGPSKKGTTELLELREGESLAALVRVKKDESWTMVATQNGRIGYVETNLIDISTPGGSGPSGPVEPQPTNNDIEIYFPSGVTEDGTHKVKAPGGQTIKGRFNIDKIKNVEKVTVNKNEARFAENIFMINIQIESGLNPINIKIQTAAGEQYEFNFTIQAP